MSTQEIRIDGGLGAYLHARVHGEVVQVEVREGFDRLSAMLDRSDQHLLYLFLQERLGLK